MINKTRNKPVIRVTQLESFRRFRDSEVAYIDGEGFEHLCSEEDAINSITGEFVGNEYTRVGTAFHSIVETGHPKCKELPSEKRVKLVRNKEVEEILPPAREFDIDGFSVKLDINQCKVALNYRNEHPHASHEIRQYKDYGEAVVTGCADVIDGIDIRDIKTKYGQIKDTDYIHSCQWRFYLDMFDLDWFFFDLFKFNGYDVVKNGYDVRGLLLTRYEPPIWCQRYASMHQDNVDLVHDFLSWARQKDILQYLNGQQVNR